ncbi:MAG TPA: YbhB/YbcL family Raf kinase inhibitor-like protein [Woeseiaceae bacterium]|nr:YbhB/YbcL family Raf kinase inhibitor-like protein [Woeseiaceae bacterium]
MGFALSDLELTSDAFRHHGKIPGRHTGEGEDVSPALAWANVPDGTEGFALVCHDPDAPLVTPGSYGFVHWVLYNIPGDVRGLDEGTGKHTCGRNDFGNNAYGGPMPPEGHGTHHYYFWLLALDSDRPLAPGLSLRELLEAVEPHVIGMNRLVGTYRRS